MIQVNRLNGSEITINALLIESIESTPDTVITLVTGNKYVVKQSNADLVQLIKAYMLEINAIKSNIVLQQRGESDV